MNRRQFITVSSAAMLATTLESFAAPVFSGQAARTVKILGTSWGYAHSIDQFCADIKAAGYDGAELGWPDDPAEQDAMFAALRKHNLDVGFLVGVWGVNDYKEHLAIFTKKVQAAARQQKQRPLYINCHSGKDFYSFEENKAFIDVTLEVARQTGIRFCHETHRSRILYSAPVTRQFINQIPDLRITMDFSHWCCVHESLLEDQPQNVNPAIERTSHIHARIGHAEGPQINDPRAPEWEKALEVHFGWWDKVAALQFERGEPLTILTEFGPPDYLPTLPYTRQPIANQWDINVHMLKVLKARYGQ